MSAPAAQTPPPVTRTAERERQLAWMAASLVILFWGTAYTGVKIALEGFGPGPLALGRFAIGTAVLLLLSVVRVAAGNPAARITPLPDREDLLPIAGLGLVGITAYHLLLNFGQQQVPPGTTSLLLQTAPVFTTILVGALGLERITWQVWAGMLVAFAGAALLVIGQGRTLSFQLSALYIVGCAITTSCHFVFQKRLVAKYGSWKFTVWNFLPATVALLPFAPGLFEEAQQASWETWGALIYLGALPGALGYALWSYAISKLGPTTCATLLYFAPLVAFTSGWIVYDEPPSAMAIKGGGLTLLGVMLVNYARGQAAKQAAAA
jgi:drug/metabolite transporter (DMT)-like permease